MKVQQARELANKARSTNYIYDEIVMKIKVLAENGHHRLITDYPGMEIIDKIVKDGYLVFDGAPSGSMQCIISW